MQKVELKHGKAVAVRVGQHKHGRSVNLFQSVKFPFVTLPVEDVPALIEALKAAIKPDAKPDENLNDTCSLAAGDWVKALYS